MILLIDNYDSFVYNLARYFEELGQVTRVVRNDAIDVAGIRSLAPTAIVLSPGPCDPEQAGVSLQVVRELGSEFPILGVCLGHQAIGAAFGAKVTRDEPVHGRTSEVFHRQSGLFGGITSPVQAARYHSLIVDRDSIPPCLEVTAWTQSGVVMAMRHRELPITGVQFHPESVLTHDGHRMLENFLAETSAQVPARGSKTA